METIMSKEELLRKYIDQASHNLFCYSADYAMTRPKPGYEKDFAEAERELEMLEEMLANAQAGREGNDDER